VEEEDPAGGGGKERVVNVKTVGHGTGIVYGDVAWVPQDGEVAPGGKVEVSTSNAPLRLSL
jgi:IMP dehydrogenase/GMP reductase